MEKMHVFKVIGHIDFPNGMATYRRVVEATEHDCARWIAFHVLMQEKGLKVILMSVDGMILPDIVYVGKP
jgi:hypothetical protein